MDVVWNQNVTKNLLTYLLSGVKRVITLSKKEEQKNCACVRGRASAESQFEQLV